MIRRKLSLEDLLLVLSESLMHQAKSLRVNGIRHWPYVDYRDDGDFVTLTAELPNVKTEDVKVTAGRNRIEVSATGGGPMTFREAYNTPPINLEDMTITFKNSILQIKAPRSR